MTQFKTQIEIVTHLRHQLHSQKIVYTGSNTSLIHRLSHTVYYATEGWGGSLGMRLAIATTHLYDWVHRLITN